MRAAEKKTVILVISSARVYKESEIEEISISGLVQEGENLKGRVGSDFVDAPPGDD